MCFIGCHAVALTALTGIAVVTALRPEQILLVDAVMAGLSAPLLFQVVGPRSAFPARRCRPGMLPPPLRRLRQHGTCPYALADTAEHVGRALGARFAVVEIYDDDGYALLVSRWGAEPGETMRFPLTYHGEDTGALLLDPADESTFTADAQAFDEVLTDLAVAANLYRTSDALWRAKLAVHSERERERQRLRRDLHDGLGPTLAAIMMQIDAAHALATNGSNEVTDQLTELQRDAHVAVADMKQMVRELSPRGLTGHGLLSSIYAFAGRFERASRGGLRVWVDVPDQLPELPSQVELTVYHLVGEALTNVARHAHARQCVVRLRIMDGVDVEVMDDGVGLPEGPYEGFGLSSIRARVREARGECVIERLPRGTRVWARLPCVDGDAA